MNIDELWCQTFVAAIRAGKSSTMAAEEADSAVYWYKTYLSRRTL